MASSKTKRVRRSRNADPQRHARPPQKPPASKMAPPPTSITLGGCDNMKLKLSDHELPVRATKSSKSAPKPAQPSTGSSWTSQALQTLQTRLSGADALSTTTTTTTRPLTTLAADADDWHVIPERSLTPEQARDLRLIENRAHIDGKRFYKSSGTGRRRGELPTRVHFGTVKVGAHEFFSARLTRRQRRSTFVEEVLADDVGAAKTHDRFKRLLVKRKISKRVVDPSAKRRHVRR